jgi:hypothetical protein
VTCLLFLSLSLFRLDSEYSVRHLVKLLPQACLLSSSLYQLDGQIDDFFRDVNLQEAFSAITRFNKSVNPIRSLPIVARDCENPRPARHHFAAR